MNKKYDFSNIINHINNEIDSNRISGASLLIYKDGEILLNECFGYANIEKKYKITDNTRFRLASMTKPITGVAAMIAQELGLFNIDDFAYKYIPEIKDRKIVDLNLNVIDEGPYNFTIRELLNHSAGFGCAELEGVCQEKLMHDENTHELKDFINDARNMNLYFKPGTHFAYSGSMAYNLVARIIEITSGMKYIDFLNKYILEPLEMNHTSYVYNDNEEYLKAISYKSEDNKLIYVDDRNRGFDAYYPGFNCGGAGLISTKDDYYKFAMMLYNKGVYKNIRILKEESIEEMLKAIPTPNCFNGGLETFGISFFVRMPVYSDWQKLPSGSYGWSGAYGPHFWIDPSNQLIVIYMHNSSTFGGAGAPQHTQLESDVVELFNLKR